MPTWKPSVYVPPLNSSLFPGAFYPFLWGGDRRNLLKTRILMIVGGSGLLSGEGIWALNCPVLLPELLSPKKKGMLGILWGNAPRLPGMPVWFHPLLTSCYSPPGQRAWVLFFKIHWMETRPNLRFCTWPGPDKQVQDDHTWGMFWWEKKRLPSEWQEVGLSPWGVPVLVTYLQAGVTCVI